MDGSPWGSVREARWLALRLAGRYMRFWRRRFTATPPEKGDVVACIMGLRRAGVDPGFVESLVEEFYAFKREDYGTKAFYRYVLESWREACTR